jgi:phosphosulfolactate phosphohydrolase-like enzyme
VRVHVAFTPAETAPVPTGIVVDVLRATSTIAQALAGGYSRVLCCAQIDEARALRDEVGEAVLAGERKGSPYQASTSGTRRGTSSSPAPRI